MRNMREVFLATTKSSTNFNLPTTLDVLQCIDELRCSDNTHEANISLLTAEPQRSVDWHCSKKKINSDACIYFTLYVLRLIWTLPPIILDSLTFPGFANNLSSLYDLLFSLAVRGCCGCSWVFVGVRGYATAVAYT